MTNDLPSSAQDAALGSVARLIEEAADRSPWALVGSAALRLQGVATDAQNLDFITSSDVATTLSQVLGIEPGWNQGPHLASGSLRFLRHGVPVFVLADPVFHGPYETLKPMEIPSFWDARIHRHSPADGVPCSTTEWELVLAVVTGARDRSDLLGRHLRTEGFDSRLVVRLLREGRVERETEEAVWSILERGE